MDHNVFLNSSGFLKIYGENPLDRTRIHSENYHLTQKICADAYEEEGEEDKNKKKNYDKNYFVSYIMKNPQILEDLDFDEYARHLA